MIDEELYSASINSGLPDGTRFILNGQWYTYKKPNGLKEQVERLLSKKTRIWNDET